MVGTERFFHQRPGSCAACQAQPNWATWTKSPQCPTLTDVRSKLLDGNRPKLAVFARKLAERAYHA